MPLQTWAPGDDMLLGALAPLGGSRKGDLPHDWHSWEAVAAPGMAPCML